MGEEKRANIRNSTAEFLIFTGQSGESNIEVRVADGTVWLSQKLMGNLFKVSVKTINEHLINLFNQKELQKEATIRNFRIVQNEGELAQASENKRAILSQYCPLIYVSS